MYFKSLIKWQENNFSHPSKSINTNVFEIRQFFGINILMGNIKCPIICMYWQIATSNDLVADAMPVNRFFKIQKNIHCVADKEPSGRSNQSLNRFEMCACLCPIKYIAPFTNK